MGGQQIAFIRGINVGKAKRVAMADLRALVEELGYHKVRTLLNSGNVIFTALDADTSASALRIQEALATRLGVSAGVIAIAAEELSAVVSAFPFAEIMSDPSRLLVAFLAGPEDQARLKALKALELQDWNPEALAVDAGVAYMWCPDGILKSQLPVAVGKIVGEAATTRNWATVMKLFALAQTQPG